jgi:hypothetical protein
MARDGKILMRADLFQDPLEWVGPKIKTFLGPEMATREASATGAQKSQDHTSPPELDRSMGVFLGLSCYSSDTTVHASSDTSAGQYFDGAMSIRPRPMCPRKKVP